MDIKTLKEGATDQLAYQGSLATDADRNAFCCTAVAFANGAGGRIVLGVDEGSETVQGLPVEDVPTVMEAVERLVAEYCVPELPMRTLVTTLEGCSVVAVDVFPSRRLPCWLREQGPATGVYVRVGAETRLADPELVREFEFRGSRCSWDSVRPAACRPLEADRLQQFCDLLQGAAQRNARRLGLLGADVRPDVETLRQWHLVEKADGRLWPTYGFEILEGSCKAVMGAAVRCGLFLGTTRVQIGDTKIYDGPLVEQYESAMEWLLSKLEVREVEMDGKRCDVTELPVDAVRELLLWALSERSWHMGDEVVTVALYRDRLEITSPGGRPNALSRQELLSGCASPRNPAIARALAGCHFPTLGGGCFPRVAQAMRRWRLRAPEVTDFGRAIRVVLYRPDAAWRVEALLTPDAPEVLTSAESVSPEDIPTAALSADEDLLLAAIRKNPAMTTVELVEQLAASGCLLSARQIRYLEDKLKAKGRLIRKGRGGGHWIIPD